MPRLVQRDFFMSYSPQLARKCDSEFSRIDNYTIPLSEFLKLRIYSDTRPYNGKIADLQKGLILVYKGIEMVGEGTGFGVPILICLDETYFSGSSNVYVSQHNDAAVICKEFLMDKIARNKFRNASSENRKVRGIFRYIGEVYRQHKHLQSLTLKGLFMKMGYHTIFVKTKPIGKVIVTYNISKSRILVKVDMNLLKKENLQKVFILNEQGSRFFRKYLDSDGTELFDKAIGAWNPILAKWASITGLKGAIGFRLRRTENSILRRGQEFLPDSLDWIGLDYEIDSKNAVFEYDINILGV
jgi:hypothetical protein